MRNFKTGASGSFQNAIYVADKENEQPLSGLRQAEAALLKRLGFVTVRGRTLPLAAHDLCG